MERIFTLGEERNPVKISLFSTSLLPPEKPARSSAMTISEVRHRKDSYGKS